MGRVTARLPVTKVRYADPPGARRRADVVAVEEPLEVRAGGQVLTVTMRTPGDDLDLVHGWLLAEGVLRRAEDLRTARYCAGAVETGPDGTPQNTYNVLDVDLAPEALAAVPAAQRLGLTSSACGVCGSASIEVLAAKLPGGGLADVDTTLDIATIPELVEGLGAAQRTFAKTGGTHAAALYGAGGELRSAAEDVDATTPSTRSSARPCAPAPRCRSAASFSSPPAPPSRSSRRPRWPACRSSLRCRHRLRWPSRRPGISG